MKQICCRNDANVSHMLPKQLQLLVILIMMAVFSYTAIDSSQLEQVSNTKSSSKNTNTNITADTVSSSDDTSISNKNIEMDFATAHVYEIRTILSNYTWEANTNRWVPPMGVPYLRVGDIQNIFLHENTVWVGDSTSRQDYHTMYHLLHTDTEHETSKTLDLAAPRLNTYLNRGKEAKEAKHVNWTSYCPARQQPEGLDFFSEAFLEIGQVKGADQNCSAMVSRPSTNNWSKFALDDNKTGKFDLKRDNCYGQMISFLETSQELVKREYSVMILSSGNWEVLRPKDCIVKTGKLIRPNTDVFVDVLEFLQNLSGPNLFVVWKTCGPSTKLEKANAVEQKKVYNELNSLARNWFEKTKPVHMDLVDFDLAIQERGWGKDRIKGDSHAHWGLEARLLSIEMVSDAVRRKQERNKFTKIQSRK